MNTCKALLLIAALSLPVLSVACSSTGSGTVSKDIYGNITGHWQLVVDDNGYVTYVWVSTKPGAPLEAAPLVDSAGGWTGPVQGSVLMLVGPEAVEFAVSATETGVVLTAPGYLPLLIPLSTTAW